MQIICYGLRVVFAKRMRYFNCLCFGSSKVSLVVQQALGNPAKGAELQVPHEVSKVRAITAKDDGCKLTKAPMVPINIVAKAMHSAHRWIGPHARGCRGQYYGVTIPPLLRFPSRLWILPRHHCVKGGAGPWDKTWLEWLKWAKLRQMSLCKQGTSTFWFLPSCWRAKRTTQACFFNVQRRITLPFAKRSPPRSEKLEDPRH